MKPRRALSFLLAAALCAACQQAPPRAGADAALPAYEAPPADGATVYRLDPAASRVAVYVYRSGAAARFGHNHVIEVPKLEGWAALDGDDPKTGRFALRFALADLAIDDPARRAQTGGGFAGERPAADIAGTRRNLLKSLEAERYPAVVLRSAGLRGEWPWLVARLTIVLHGVARTQELVLHAQRKDGVLRVDGRFAIRQSDFGIAPFSVLGGALAVDDPLAIAFELRLRAAA